MLPERNQPPTVLHALAGKQRRSGLGLEAQREAVARPGVRLPRRRDPVREGRPRLRLFLQGHPLHGTTFEALGAITPLVDLWVEERRLPDHT